VDCSTALLRGVPSRLHGAGFYVESDYPLRESSACSDFVTRFVAECLRLRDLLSAPRKTRKGWFAIQA